MLHSIFWSFSFIVLFAPLMIWQCSTFRRIGFNFLDNFIWCLAGLLSSALITLWISKFTTLYFCMVYTLFVLGITFIRSTVSFSVTSLTSSRFSTHFMGFMIVAITMLFLTENYTPKSDALAYHLPMAAQWVQTHTIFAQDSRVWFYPGNFELLTAIVFLLAGNDHFWFVPLILSFVLFVVASYKLLCALHVNEKAAVIFIAILTMNPLFFRCLMQGDNDFWVMTLVIAAITSLLETNRQARAVGLLCIAMLMGSKYAAMPWLALIGLYSVFQRKKALRNFGLFECSVILIGLLLVSSFPLRNYLLTGNPFYPMGLGSWIPWGDTSHLVSLITPITPQQLSASSLVHQDVGVWQILLMKILFLAPVLPVVVIVAIVLACLKKSVFIFRRENNFIWLACLLAWIVFIFQPLVVENIPGTKNQLLQGFSGLRFALPGIALLSFLCFSNFRHDYINRLIPHKMQNFIRNKVGYMWALIFIIVFFLIVKNLTLPVSQPMHAYRYGDRSVVVYALPKNACFSTLVVSTGIRAGTLLGSQFEHRVIAVGMSASAEEFKQQAIKNHASMIIVASEDMGPLSPEKGKFPPETRRMLAVLGNAWEIKYQNSYVMVFAKKQAGIVVKF